MKQFKLIKTVEESCSSCKGTGSACESGSAWIYCETRRDNDDKFDGDCGEMLGCNKFIAAKSIIMKWANVNDEPIPRDGKEYLTKNDLQGGVKGLISWNNIHKHFTNKGQYIFEGNAGTHWLSIPE